MCQACMSLHRRQRARSSTFISGSIRFTDSECEVRIVVKKEGGHMIVVDHEQNVWLFFSEPLLHGPITFKDRSPCRIVLFVSVESEPDRWRMRTGNAADYSSQRIIPCS